MEIAFYGTYDKAIFVEAMRLTEKRTTIGTIFRYLALVVSVLIIGGTLYAWFSDSMDRSSISRLIRNIVTAALIGYYYFSGIISRQRLLSKLFHSGPRRTMQGKANFEGIFIGQNDNTVLFKWDQFMSKGEQEKIYALMTVDGSVAVFHHDFFSSESDWQRFKQMANQRVVEPK